MKDMVTHMPDRYKIVETLIQHVRDAAHTHTYRLLLIIFMLNISLSFSQGMWFFTEELDKDEKVRSPCCIAYCTIRIYWDLHTDNRRILQRSADNDQYVTCVTS